MKEFIAKYLTPTIVIIIVILLTIFAMTKLSQYSAKHSEQVIATVDQSQLRQHLTDSLLRVQSKREIAVIDSVNALRINDRKVSDVKIHTLTVKTDGLQTKLNVQLSDYRSDTTAQSDKCDSVITTQQDIIQNQDTTIQELDKETVSYSLSLYDLNTKYEIQKQETERCNKSNDIATKNVGILTNELKKKDNWWNRNQKWFYLVGGATVTYLIVK